MGLGSADPGSIASFGRLKNWTLDKLRWNRHHPPVNWLCQIELSELRSTLKSFLPRTGGTDDAGSQERPSAPDHGRMPSRRAHVAIAVWPRSIRAKAWAWLSPRAPSRRKTARAISRHRASTPTPMSPDGGRPSKRCTAAARASSSSSCTRGACPAEAA